jgi:hypothetical protein
MSPNQALLAIGADAPQPKRQRWGNNKNRMKSNRFKWTLVSIAAFILIGAGIFCYVLKTMRAHCVFRSNRPPIPILAGH